MVEQQSEPKRPASKAPIRSCSRGLRMNKRKIAIVIASGFFFIWLGILYAGADHPPPPGFIWTIILDLVCSLVVYFRVSTYIDWSNTRKKYRLFYPLFDGLSAGIVIALITMLIPSEREPHVRLVLIDYLIWFAALGAVGAANAMLVYGISATLSKKTTPLYPND